MSTGFELIESKLIYKGTIMRLYEDKVKSPKGQILDREVVKRFDAVGVAALTAENEMVFVRQYRHAVRSNLLEIPAGLLADTEDTLDCAIRELREETGYRTSKVEKIAEFYTSGGYSDEKLFLYYTGEIEPGESELEPGEEGLQVEIIPLVKAVDMVVRGEIEDAKTLIAILMTAQRIGWMKPEIR